MPLPRSLHIHEPLGADGRAPFSPVLDEITRIRHNVANILTVLPGEWPMNVYEGSPVEGMLDEPDDDVTIRILKAGLRGRIQKYERHATILALEVVSVDDDLGRRGLKVGIVLFSLREQQNVDMTVTLGAVP